MAIVTFAGSLLSLTALPFVASPDASSFPLLILTILIHTGYHFFLPVAYDHGDLGQVYPIARGSAPILVTVGALLLACEPVDRKRAGTGKRLYVLGELGVVGDIKQKTN